MCQVNKSDFTWYFLLWLLWGFLKVSIWLELSGFHWSWALLLRAHTIEAFFLSVNKHTHSSKCQKCTPSDDLNCLADLALCSRDLWWHLDLASFCTETLRGVKAEMGGQRPLVGQGDGPWNSLAHHMQAKINELAVDLQLVGGKIQKTRISISISREELPFPIYSWWFWKHRGYQRVETVVLG